MKKPAFPPLQPGQNQLTVKPPDWFIDLHAPPDLREDVKKAIDAQYEREKQRRSSDV